MYISQLNHIQMKRVALLFAIIASSVLFFSSCEKETVLVVDQQLLMFTETGGSQIISLTANKPWTAKADQSWCKVAPTAGEDAASSPISINCEPNTSYDSRTCNITFTCAELTKTVSVTQSESNGLIISQTDYSISSDALQINVEVQANVKFSVAVDDACKSWIRHTATKGLTTNTVVLDVSENDTYDAREGWVKISQTDGTLFSTVKITQAQRDTIHVEAEELTIHSRGGLLEITVASNADYSVNIEDSAKDWISVVETKAIRESKITLKIEPNEIEEPREGKVTVQNKDGKVASSFVVKQRAKNTIVASLHEFVASSAGEVVGLTVTASVDYEVVIPKDVLWVSRLPENESAADSVYFQIATNTTEEARTATILFVNEEEEISDSLKVEQNPMSVALNNEILYKSSDGNIIIPYANNFSEASITSNTMTNGVGSIRFDKGLRQVGNQAFYNRTTLVSVILPEGVEEVGESVFDNCLRLENVYLPQTVKKIGEYPFKNCRKLKGLSLPKDITTIPSGLLYGCTSVDSLIMPESVTEIGKQVFYECSNIKTIVLPKSYAGRIEGEMFAKCTKLEAIDLPEGITYIAPSAFSECSKLKSIILPPGLSKIEYDTFYGCTSLASVKVPEDLIEIGHQAFMRCSSLSTFEIPSSVTKLGYGVFRECSNLVKATLPPEITQIPDHLFYECKKLTNITIPEGVTFIGYNAFNGCESFTSITIPDGVETIENEVFQGCKNLSDVKLPSALRSIGYFSFAHCAFKTINIPSGVTYIETHAFRECPNLESIVLPDGISVIKANTFYDCQKLTTVTLPKNLTTLEYGAFNQCYSLKTITIPEGVTRIEGDAFSLCRSLETITIPSTVTFLGYNAFNNCWGLKEIKCLPSTPPTCENNGVFGSTGDCPIYVPSGSVTAYKTAEYWKDYADRIKSL